MNSGEETNGTDSPDNSDDSGNLDDLFEGIEHQVESDRDNLVINAQSNAQNSMKRALDIKARLVTDPAYANILSERHNAALISQEYITLLKLLTETGDKKYEEALKCIRVKAKKFGFFLFKDGQAFMEERLQKTESRGGGSHFVIAETYGRHPDPKSEWHETGLWAADCQIQIPGDTMAATSVVQSPDEGKGDVIHNRVFTDAVHEHPESVIIIEDIVCDMRLAHLELASLAMSHSLEEVIYGVNPQRLHKLGHVAAEIAAVTGVILPKGKRIEDHNGGVQERICFDGKHQIFNGRSMRIFEQFDSPLCSEFELAFQRKDVEHDILMPGDDIGNPHKLVVTWNVMIAKLEDAESKRPSTVTAEAAPLPPE